MKVKVTKQGIIVPKTLLEGIDEVEVRKQQDVIVITPVSVEDPILSLGSTPVIDSIVDASINHDQYIYKS